MISFKSGSTNIAAAIDLTAKIIRKERNRHTIVILITDGFADNKE